MADKTLPDSESVRQIASSLRSLAECASHDNYIGNSDMENCEDAADALEAQSARISKLEEALKEVVAANFYDDDTPRYLAAMEAARALTETK